MPTGHLAGANRCTVRFPSAPKYSRRRRSSISGACRNPEDQNRVSLLHDMTRRSPESERASADTCAGPGMPDQHGSLTLTAFSCTRQSIRTRNITFDFPACFQDSHGKCRVGNRPDLTRFHDDDRICFIPKLVRPGKSSLNRASLPTGKANQVPAPDGSIPAGKCQASRRVLPYRPRPFPVDSALPVGMAVSGNRRPGQGTARRQLAERGFRLRPGCRITGRIGIQGIKIAGTTCYSDTTRSNPGTEMMANAVEARLAEIGIELPMPPAAVAAYVPFVRSGKLVHVSGQLPISTGVPQIGKLGADTDIETGAAAARLCAINLLAQIREACGGDLDRLDRVVKLTGFVNCTPDFKDHPKGRQRRIRTVPGGVGRSRAPCPFRRRGMFPSLRCSGGGGGYLCSQLTACPSPVLPQGTLPSRMTGETSSPDELTVTVHRSITEIAEEEWDCCACPETAAGSRPGDPFTTHRFLKALEVSGSVGGATGWDPVHVAVRGKERNLRRHAPLCEVSQPGRVRVRSWLGQRVRTGWR